MVDDGRTDGRRTDGRTTEHGYTISSPCEPDGSGELKMAMLKIAVNLSKIIFFSIIILHAHLQYVWNMSAKY